MKLSFILSFILINLTNIFAQIDTVFTKNGETYYGVAKTASGYTVI